MIKEKFTYATIMTVVSTVVAFLYVMSNDWFGKGDLQGFAFFSFILSLLSLLLFKPLQKLFSLFKIIPTLILTLTVSIIQTIVFTVIVWLILGPWIGAYSFPIIWCWLSGITVSNLFILIISDSSFQVKHFALGAGVVVIVFLGIATYGGLKDQLAKEQNFDIICLTHYPSQVKPQLSDLTKYSLTPNEAQAVLDLGLRGSFWTDTFFRVRNSKLVSTDFPDYDFDRKKNNPGAELEFLFGNDLDTVTNESPKIIIIMNHPQENDFSVNQPIGRSVIVYQKLKENNFKTFGLGENYNTKELKIKGTDFHGFPYSTPLILELKNRGEIRLNGFQWLKN